MVVAVLIIWLSSEFFKIMGGKKLILQWSSLRTCKELISFLCGSMWTCKPGMVSAWGSVMAELIVLLFHPSNALSIIYQILPNI